MKAEIRQREVLVDGKPFHILSGEMHYFRIHPSQWRDRLEKLKACGLNTVATYMPWNLHERTEGTFNFSGMLDLRHYLELADELGLKAVLRPGPYICSEWDLGGLPAWLLKRQDLRIRCSDPEYCTAVKRYFEAVFDEVKELFDRNIILLQIENGYASYGNDMAYYEFLKKVVDDSGYPNIVITADGDSDTRINSRVPDGVWQTLMAGDNVMECLEFQRKELPDRPQMVIEYWDGQGIRTGQPLRLRDSELIAENLDKALAFGAHINLYMFGGGTNFGFMNGAMRAIRGDYKQLLTSYDVCAPLSEAGDITEKYLKIRDVLKKYNPEFDTSSAIPANAPQKAYGKVQFTEFAALADNLDALSVQTTESPTTLTMEQAGGDYGYIRYTTQLARQSFVTPMRLYRFQDRAWVYFNGRLIASLSEGANECFSVDARNGGGQLDIVLENMGRSCFYCNMEENRKGISGGLIVNNQQFQHGWKISTMPLENTAAVTYGPLPDKLNGPAFLRGTFEAEEMADTFLEVSSGTRGICRINGMNLGRYDNGGPQFTLYIPAAFLKKGENTIEVLEYATMRNPFVRLLDHPHRGE